MTFPLIIQGGMGVGVSGWLLAKQVSAEGQLGVVSGAIVEIVFVRRLQIGDVGGHIKRALGHFPNREIAQRIYEKYYLPPGKMLGRFISIPKWTLNPSQELLELTVVANFVEVWLAKEGHRGIVGINYLAKIQLPNLPSLYGAMLAKVDYILVGAGIPSEFPAVLDNYVEHKIASLKINVQDADSCVMRFDPKEVIGEISDPLKRPIFLAIISSHILAKSLNRISGVDGFIIEGPIAGGHNAPPRGPLQLDIKGEPIYGERDIPDIERIKSLNKPFWLAGGYGSPMGLRSALDSGAVGVQLGTAFALCKESTFATQYKQQMLQQIKNNCLVVFTDAVASPTGFPFKVAELGATLSKVDVYNGRPRKCDVCHLRVLYKKPDGSIGYRCPSEPVNLFIEKGGREAETEGRKCLCNALLSAISLERVNELPLITLGGNVTGVKSLIKQCGLNYSATDVIKFVLGK